MNYTNDTMFASLLTLLSDIAGKKSEVLVCEVMQERKLIISSALNPRPEHAQGLAFEALEVDMLECDEKILHTRSTTQDGRSIKTTVMPLRDDGRTVGCIVVNADITEIAYMQKYLSGIMEVGQPEHSDEYTDINQLLDNLLEKALGEIGKPVAYMKKADKRAFIKYLDDKGYFQIKKSADKVMKYLNISKFTLYSHLEEIRSTDDV